MKNVAYSFALILLATFTNSGYSQINSSELEKKLHESMSGSIASAKQQALAIAKDTSKSTIGKLKNTEAVLKQLEAAKQSHLSLKSAATSSTTAAQIANGNIEKNHAEATKYASELRDELTKTTPNNLKVQDLSSKLTTSLGELEKSHQQLQGIIK
jgi:hypothetical protein